VDDYYTVDCTQNADTPKSQSCKGHSVTIGNADGTCSQGGMGVFQIDAGTQEQTVAKYGSKVVEVEGNTELAIDHVLNDLWNCSDTPDFGKDENTAKQKAIAWMNGVKRGTADYDKWFQCVAKHYNGCVAPGCAQNTRANQYKTDTEALVSEFGVGYWTPAPGHPVAAPVCSGTAQVDYDPSCLKTSVNWVCADSEGTDAKQHWTCNTAANNHADGDGNLYRCNANGTKSYVACANGCHASAINAEDFCQ
jgi:hypothetical protein